MRSCTTSYYLRYPICPRCGAGVDRDASDCPYCATPLLVERYRLVRLIAQTPISSLFEAVDLRTRRRCAIKRMVPASGQDGYAVIDDDLLGLEQLRGLSCVPRRTRVIFTEIECFLILPAIAGVPLADLADRPWDAAQVMGFLDAGLALLDTMHRRGVALRDLTPSNLIYTTNERLMLIDYGQFTPHQANPFAAPEVGLYDRLDPRSDLYHLGATAYSLISGGLPPNPHYNQRHVGGSDLPEVLRKTLDELLDRDVRRRPHHAAVARARLRGTRGSQALLFAALLLVAVALGAWMALVTGGVQIVAL